MATSLSPASAEDFEESKGEEELVLMDRFQQLLGGLLDRIESAGLFAYHE